MTFAPRALFAALALSVAAPAFAQSWEELQYSEDAGGSWAWHIGTDSAWEPTLAGTANQLELDIFLLPGQHYVVEWTEKTNFKPEASGGVSHDTPIHRFVSGNWSVGGSGEVILSGFGVLQPQEVNGRPGAQTRIDVSPGSPGAQGLTVPVQKVHSTYTLYGLKSTMAYNGVTYPF